MSAVQLLPAPYDEAVQLLQQPTAAKSRAVWIIAGAIVIPAAIIAIAVMSGKRSAPPAAAPSIGSAASPQASATCAAWRATAPALKAIPGLPAGWNWDTPNIDGMINQSRAAVNTALDLFEPRIADAPTDVAAEARAYVAAKRAEWAKLADHSYTASDGVAVSTSLARLNELCGFRD